MTVTLETLRADFENHRLFAENDPLEIRWIALEEAWAEGHRFPPRTAGFVGLIYIIARDYDFKAAMAYKLSDGAIDPRVSNAAC
ncbi:hypothetical protein DM806_13675 [Sphingobium lactosutens]|uniref:hypothetical protein n=1 Tax=Sphingobium lactosutens TaxID=522773 RepID=UPI0015BECD2E|nr:hypothetical protein [Sphingobium lactosutens]NWK96690.1 hypothetical protein [Sphingobium lactosutens]